MPRITLAPLPRSKVSRVLHLELPSHQDDFVAPIADMVDEPDRLQDFHVVLDDGHPVGFFKIDRDFARRIARLPPRAHGFRGLLIGGQYQGCGLGGTTLAALPEYAAKQYSVAALWLSVDQHNTAAIGLYERFGWAADGPPHQGRIGLEQVMYLTLSCKP